MALRLRRGTNAERQLITPAQGELIYTTDTKALYIGDGTTAGGIVVQGAGGGGGSLNDLSDVNVGSVTDGQVLSYNTANSQWQPANSAGITLGKADTLEDINYGPDTTARWGDILLHDGASFIAENFIGSQWKISIAGDDSTIIVDHTTNNINANNITGNLLAATGTFTGSITKPSTALEPSRMVVEIAGDAAAGTAHSRGIIHGLTIKNSNDQVVYDPVLDQFSSNFIGNLQGNIFAADMTQVFDKTSGQWLGDIQGDIYATDSTKVFNALEVKFYGNFDGVLDGDHKGSVYGDDSSLLIDGVNSKITGEVSTQLGVLAGNIKMVSASSKNMMFLQQNAESNFLTVTTENSGGGIVLARNTQVGGANVTGDTVLTVFNDNVTQGVMHIRTTNSNDTANAGGGIGVLRSRGTKTSPTAVQVGDQIGGFYSAGYNGSGYKAASGIRSIVAGTPTANHIPSNVELYNSNTSGVQQAVLSIAQTDSVATFSGAIQLKVVADDTARSAAVTAPAAGMIIFNSTGTKFQGYTGAAWVDLN